MKIAVTSAGTDLDSDMDPRFGRARYIVVLDEHGTILETVDNSTNLNALKGAGIQAAKTLADRKVNTLITGNCGPNAYKALSAAGIKVAVEQTGTVKEAFERFQRNELEFADRPNVEGHW